MKIYEEVELQLHTLLTSALHGMSGQVHTPADLLLGKELPAVIEWEPGWASEPSWTRWRIPVLTDNGIPVMQPVASHYTH